MYIVGPMMSKTIRDTSPIFQRAEELVDLASQLPDGSEPHEMAKALRPVLDLADQFDAAFTAQGWVFVEFCCGFEPATQALAMKQRARPSDEIDGFLADHLLNVEPLYWQAKKLLGGGMAEPAYPVRAEVVERTFRAYREADFIACVPLVLMLIDGFGVTRTGTKSIFSDLADLADLLEEESSVGGHPTGMKAVLQHMIRMKKGYSEEELTLPLRNGILHGTRLNYANKIVAAKALCVLAAVIEWARDTATVPKDEAAKVKWNTQFLTTNLARLSARSPDEALESLQRAFNRGRPHEALVLVDYHPLNTHLQSKLSEWSDLLSAAWILIVRQGEWEVFGTPSDSEQHARCTVELTVQRNEDGVVSRTEEMLHATRQKDLKELGLEGIWQIGLPVLGTIRRKLASN